MKPHSQFFHIQWERQSFQLKRHSHPQCRAPGTSSLGTHGSLLMSSWMSIWPWGLQTKLCQNVHMPQEKDSALFWPSAFGTVIYSFCLFVSRNAVHLGPSLGCGTKQAFKSKWGMHKLFFFFFWNFILKALGWAIWGIRRWITDTAGPRGSMGAYVSYHNVG